MNYSFNIKVALGIIFLLFSIQVFAQDDDLDALLGSLEQETTEYVTGTFKSTRVINLHSIEKVAAQSLDFRIAHRFGSLDGGAYEFFGLDQATIRLSLEYGVTNWLMVGVGRSTYEKTIDGFLKLNVLRQSTGKRNMPIGVSYFSSVTSNGLKWTNTDRTNYFRSRLAYVHQIIIARKMSNAISLQLSPTIVHKNLVATVDDQNVTGAVGLSGRIKLSKRVTWNAEYIYRVPPSIETAAYTDFYNSFSIGFDIETGGHVFALHVSNSLPMIEKGFITETNKSWENNGIHFGFNISREFTFRKIK